MIVIMMVLNKRYYLENTNLRILETWVGFVIISVPATNLKKDIVQQKLTEIILCIFVTLDFDKL